MVRIKVCLNGPYLVETDDVELVDGTASRTRSAGVGRALPVRRIREQTFCDGTHSKIGFHAAEAGRTPSSWIGSGAPCVTGASGRSFSRFRAWRPRDRSIRAVAGGDSLPSYSSSRSPLTACTCMARSRGGSVPGFSRRRRRRLVPGSGGESRRLPAGRRAQTVRARFG